MINNNNQEEFNEMETERTTIVELVNTFKEATGLELVKNGIKWMAIGSFMGVSDAVPGYSGGTSLAVLGFLRRLILVSKSIFIPEPGITRWKAFLFMLPFGAGWLIGVFGFAKLTEMMSMHGLVLELMFFFSTFILFTVPIFLRAEKPDLVKDVSNSGKFEIKFKRSRRWVIFFIGFFTIFGIGMYILIVQHGYPLNQEGNADTWKLTENWHWLALMGVAYLSGFISLIPGGSGALMQFLTGYYKHIHWTSMSHPIDHPGAIILFAASTLAGMITMVFIMAWGLKKHQQSLAAFALGMMLASVPVLIMVPEWSTWGELGQAKHYVGLPLSLMGGTGIGLSLNFYIKSKQRKAALEKETKSATSPKATKTTKG